MRDVQGLDGEAPLTSEIVQVLVDNHRQFLSFLERRLGDRALAEDVLQEAFVRGVGKLSMLNAEESAIAWFYRILRNAVTDHYRRRASASKKLATFAEQVDLHASQDDELHRSVCECISRLVTTLKPEYAEALRRVELEGLSVKDYATAAGITGNNAAVRLFRARDALRKRVSRSCGTCAEHGCLDCTCKAPGEDCH
jgi:RNA polymerase sigma factor (sigma-70 family)